MLQDVRKQRELSQSQLAKKSSQNLRMIQHYEQGFKNIDGAKLDTLCDLAIALDCKLWDILTDDNLKEKVKKATTR